MSHLADDTLKSESQRDLADIVFDVSSTAAAFGAGAVSLYRSGKGKQYLELLTRTREFARGAANELFSHSYNDLNSKTLLQMGKNFKKSWRNIEQDVKRKPIQLSLKDDNLITAAAEYTSLTKNLPNVAKEMYNGKLFSETMKRAGDVGPKHARQYADFLRDIISAGETPDKSVIDNIRREFNPKNDTALDKLAQSSIAFIQKRRQEKPYVEFEDEILDTLREGIKEKFLNQKNLADRFGASYLKRTKTDKLLGDRPLTLKELLDKKHLVKSEMYHGISADNDTFQIDLLKNLEDLANQIKAEKGDEAYNDFMSLYVDKTIRKDDTGTVYSARVAKNFFSDLLNSAARTMPGKVLKLRDIEQSLQEPNFHLTATGSNDPVLASILGNDKSSIVDGDFLRILNKTYSITENGLEHVKELDDVRLISSRFGSLSRQIQKMSGEESRRDIEEGTLRDWFDIGTTPGKMMFEEMFSKNKKKEFRGKINEFFDPSIEKIAEVMTSDEADIQRNFETIQDFTRFLNKNIFQLSEEAVKKLNDQVSSGNAKYILSVLRQSDEEMMQSLLTKYGSALRSSRNDTLINADLTTILRRYLRSNKEAIKDIALKGDRSNAYYQGNTPQTYYDLVRTELGKEFFLQYAKENESKEALAAVRELIESANIQKDTKNSKRLAYTALFENELRLYQKKDTIYRDNDKDRIVRDTLNIFSGKTENESLLDFRREIGNVVKEKYDNVDIRIDRDEVIQRNKPNKYIHIRKTYGAKYLIEQINRAIKGEANLKDVTAPATQFFTAGRGNMKNVTTASMIPYTAISRLTEEMERIGLGFSSKYTDNFLKYSAHFGLKRIAPIALGYNYYDWFDDTVQAITGTGTTAMFFNGLANVDLGVRRINDTFELTDVFSNFKDINPMAQYVFGKDEIQSYEERLDYYKNGYDPVRSGRFWIFASSNEFRGGKIQYFEPNLIRRLNSDYEDKAFYDGYFDKWSHSLLPTPLNPISPIIGILDPYWLESRFKDERPYALSAPLFSQNTPWGVILNPTIGEMIKPQKKMHQDRLYGGIDAKALLYQMNKEHFREEINEERANTIVLAGGKTNVLTYNQFDTEITTRAGWNPIWGYDLNKYKNEKYGIAPKKDYDGEFMLDISSIAGMLGGEGGIAFNVGGGGGGIGGPGENGGPAEFFDFTRGVPQAISPEDRYLEELHGKLANTAFEKFEENLTKDAGKGKVGALVALKMITQDSPVLSLQIIRNANIRIKQRAAVQDRYSTMRGTVADTIYNSSENIADLLNAPIGTDMVSEAAISARLITGIYGYAAERFLGIGDENTPHIANAGNMTGFSRWFWDQGFGGLGGGASEIGRRFIPAFRRKAEINPLMNEMPDWLPERFRIGDPYCVSCDTLIESGKLQFIEAKEVSSSSQVLTHKGNKKNVDNVAIRAVRTEEKVYQLKITSISAVESKFSEDHPILVIEKPQNRRISQKPVKIKIYKQANLILEALRRGISEKKALAKIAKSTIDDVSRIFKLLYQDKKIENYKKNKHHIILRKNVKLYDLDLLSHNFVWKKVKDINTGDYVVYPIEKHLQNNIVIDMAQIVDCYPATKKYIYNSGTIKKESQFPEIYEWMEIYGVPKFKRGKRKNFLEQKRWDSKTYENAQSFMREEKVPERIQRFVEVTPEMAYSFGLYLAEGYTGNANVEFALHEKEELFFERAVQGLSVLETTKTRTFKKIKGTHGAYGTIQSKPISCLMIKLFGKGAHAKSIHDLFYDASDDIVLRLLEGYFDGDGCNFVTKTKNRYSEKMAYVEASSCNLILLLQIRKLLLRFGIIANINKKNPPRKKPVIKNNGKVINTGINYNLVIRGAEARKLTYLLWGISLENEAKRVSAKHSFFYDDYICMRVIEKKIVTGINKVYGFEVGIDNSFCTAGVATHNTLIPKGEMRLPGRGYEAINVLHPDAFGAYGIFDRFKILADVAPGSPEFKTYRKLAKQFVKNPDLVKEMQQIEERVEEQQKRHDFFNYRFAGKTAIYRQEVVSRILDDGTFKIVGSRDTYKLAGIKVNGQKNSGMSSQETLSQFLHPGQMVTLGMDEDLEARRNTDNTISAAVFADGENITETMLDANAGQKIRDGNNYADMIALHGSIMRGIGAALETAGHIDLPLISARWMRIRDPYETYLAEEVYGTPYQTWSELAASFLFPAYERAISDTNYTISGLGAMAVQSFFENKSLSKWESRALNAGVSLFNRGAFIGGALAYIIDTDNGKLFKAGQKLGSAAMILGNMWVSPQNDSLIDSMLSYGYTGYAIADLLRDKTGETSSGVIEAIQQAWKERKVPKKLSATYKAAVFGAAVGAALYGQNISIFDDNPKKWIPDRIKEKRDLDEYFDRLNYIKFMGLYHKAAREALSEEGINVEHFFRQYEKKQEEIKEIRQELADLEDRVLTNEYSRSAKILLRDRLEELEQEQMTLRGGEYTRSAALYKQAAENTMYYMTTQSNSRNWYDIIKALPKNERDYFHAFKDITDDDEREKIMNVASPMLRRALKQVWGMKQEDIESNESYFQGRNLPNFLWSGWNPKVDLADVKVKTIKNEGMLFSDFGIYESQLRDPDVINAPNLSPYESQDPVTLKANLEATMYGFGLTGVEVSVEPKASSGIDAVVNLAIVTHYQAKSAFNEVFKYM